MKWLAWPLATALAISGMSESLETKAPAENAPAQTPEQKKAAKIKAEVAKRGVGEKARVRVKFRDGHELKGTSPALRRIRSSCRRTQINSIHFQRKSGCSRYRMQTLSKSEGRDRVLPKSASMSGRPSYSSQSWQASSCWRS